MAIDKSRLLLFWFSNPQRKTGSFSQCFSIGLKPMLIPSCFPALPITEVKGMKCADQPESPVHPGARVGREGFSKDYLRAVTREEEWKDAE